MEKLTQLVSYSISLINVLINDDYNDEDFIKHKEIAERILFKYKYKISQINQIK